MPHANHDLGLNDLSAEQRYELAMTLLDSVFAERFARPIPPEHLIEVRRRVAHMDANPQPGEPWRQVIARILGQ